MTTTSSNYGRLGNQIIRDLATSFLARKFDIKYHFASQISCDRLGVPLSNGTKVYHHTAEVIDANYFHFFRSDPKAIQINLNPNTAFFQTKDIMSLIHEYIHSEEVKHSIMEANPFKERYSRNNDLFVHVRLTDAEQFNPGAQYYLDCLKDSTFDNLFIATDQPDHDIIRKILSVYPRATLVNDDEVRTMQFGSTCKHLCLSHGSFSAIIGYLSFFSTVQYPAYIPDKIWHGDMFSVPGWIERKSVY